MLPLERQKEIIKLLKTKKVLKMVELMDAMAISMDTLRRDINALVKQKKIEKIYGGVKLLEPKFGESDFDVRMDTHLEEKESIARVCSEFIKDGDCIYIDSGSTTLHIAKHIMNRKNLTVVTNSIPVVTELMNSDVEIILIGGKVRKSEQSVITFEYLFNFNELNIVKAFICTSGISIEKGISDYNLEEAITRKKIIELSMQTFVVADSSKFGKDVTVAIAPLSQIDCIVTDEQISTEIINKMSTTGTSLIVAK